MTKQVKKVKRSKNGLCQYCHQDHLGVSPYCEKYPHSDDCKCPDCKNTNDQLRRGK